MHNQTKIIIIILYVIIKVHRFKMLQLDINWVKNKITFFLDMNVIN